MLFLAHLTKVASVILLSTEVLNFAHMLVISMQRGTDQNQTIYLFILIFKSLI